MTMSFSANRASISSSRLSAAKGRRSIICSRAISGGKHVVTSNKEVIAKHGIELLALAQQHGVGLQYEASVGGGIPLIAPFKHDLVANKINAIYAIINGTTNYILTMMAKEGMDFAAALKRAQKLGYAEANPENDIEGIDANYKLAILASLAFQTQVRPEDIYREGISRLNRPRLPLRAGAWLCHQAAGHRQAER